MARSAKKNEGLHSAGKRKERGGKRRGGSLSPRPSGRIRAKSSRKSARLKRLSEALARPPRAEDLAVEPRLSPEVIPAPSSLVSRIARLSSGYVVTASFYGPDYVRHEVEASSATFAGVLAELARAVASTLEAA